MFVLASRKSLFYFKAQCYPKSWNRLEPIFNVNYIMGLIKSDGTHKKIMGLLKADGTHVIRWDS